MKVLFVEADGMWVARQHGGKNKKEARKPAALQWDRSQRHGVVINGDRTGWIRMGIEHFPKATYQFDRFRLVRELKTCLREAPEACTAAMKAPEGNCPEEVLRIFS